MRPSDKNPDSKSESERNERTKWWQHSHCSCTAHIEPDEVLTVQGFSSFLVSDCIHRQLPAKAIAVPPDQDDLSGPCSRETGREEIQRRGGFCMVVCSHSAGGLGSLNVHSQVWPLAVMNERNLGNDVGFGLFGCWVLSVSLHYEPAKTTPESKKFPRKLPNNNKESRGKWSPCCYGGRSRGAPSREEDQRSSPMGENLGHLEPIKSTKACQQLLSFLIPPLSPPPRFLSLFISLPLLGYVYRKASFHMLFVDPKDLGASKLK
ncbi:hypothetical protein QQF64_011932, partial [Cirrhinus molitorella]